MPYRDHKGALLARRDEIRRELEDVKSRVGDFDYLKWRQKELETELDDLEKSTTHFSGSRARLEQWLMSALGVIVIATSALSAVALLRRAPQVTIAPATMSTLDVPDPVPARGFYYPPRGLRGQTPHLTQSMPPPTHPMSRPGVAIDYVKGP